MRSLLKRWKRKNSPSYEEQAASEAAFWGDFTSRWIATGIIPPWADIRLAISQAISLGHRDRVLGGELENLSRKLRFLRDALRQVAALARERPIRVLDIGCGAGFLSLETARQGANVLGVDLSPGQIAVARYFGENGMRWPEALYPFYQGLSFDPGKFVAPTYSVLDMNREEPTGPFDVIFAHDAVHHLKQPEQLISRLGTILNDKGWVLLIDHQETAEQDNAWRLFRDTLEEYCQSWKEGRLSVEIPSVERYDRHVDFPPGLGSEIMEGLHERLRQEGFPLNQAVEATPDSEPPPWPVEESSFEGVSERDLGLRVTKVLEKNNFTIVSQETAFEPWRHELTRLRPAKMAWETFYGLRSLVEEEILGRIPVGGEYFFICAQK